MRRTPDETAAIVRSILAKLLVIDEARISVKIRPDGYGHSQVTILIDGAEPRGRHRELIVEWARGAGGKLMGEA